MPDMPSQGKIEPKIEPKIDLNILIGKKTKAEEI
jgi:hypothetical protein